MNMIAPIALSLAPWHCTIPARFARTWEGSCRPRSGGSTSWLGRLDRLLSCRDPTSTRQFGFWRGGRRGPRLAPCAETSPWDMWIWRPWWDGFIVRLEAYLPFRHCTVLVAPTVAQVQQHFRRLEEQIWQQCHLESSIYSFGICVKSPQELGVCHTMIDTKAVEHAKHNPNLMCIDVETCTTRSHTRVTPRTFVCDLTTTILKIEEFFQRRSTVTYKYHRKIKEMP